MLILLLPVAFADKCNPHATLVETDSFYLTQPFTKNVTIDLSTYIDAFPKMAALLPKFKDLLGIYDNVTAITEAEPMELIPFTKDENIFIIKDSVVNADSFKKCSGNGGSLVKIDSKNRDRLVTILKEHGIEKTPIHVLPFYSLLSLSDFDTIDTPSMDELFFTWQRSPPWITKDDQIEFPTGIVTENNIKVNSTPQHFKSPILCAKPNNPWDLKENRNDWFRMTPKLKTAISMLDRIKTSFETASKSLKNIPSVTKQIANAFQLTLPEPFKVVLDFLDNFTKKKQWERTSSLDPFTGFVTSALKLTRQLEQKPKSIIKIPKANPKFSPPSINELNWRESFGLDESIYGVMGPLVVKPSQAFVKDETIINPTHFEATITARVYNRLTDRLTVYEVKPNAVNNEITTVKAVVTTPHLKLALLNDVKPLQCITHETEQYRICHKMTLQPVTDTSIAKLTKCAEALFSPNISLDFPNCPRTKSSLTPVIYRAECEPDNKPMAIVNSGSPVLLGFKCDTEKMPNKNITTFPTYINTPCEVHFVEGASSQLALPQWNPDFLQDQTVGEEQTIIIPPVEMTKLQFILISIGASIGSCVLLICVIVSMYYCCKCLKQKCCNHDDAEDPEQLSNDPPVIQLHELPFISSN